MTKIAIHSYSRASAGAKLLRDTLITKGYESLVLQTGNKKQNSDLFSICWGNTPHIIDNIFDLNGRNVSVLINKQRFFHTGSDYCSFLPRYVTKKSQIDALFTSINRKKKEIVCRTVLSGHSGVGIVFIDQKTKGKDIPDCNLYVEYVPHKIEYRLHVFLKANGGERIYTQVKKRNKEALKADKIDYKVQNLEGGWVYCKTEDTIPAPLVDACTNILKALNLHFAAFDIIYDPEFDRYYILEANSAPGLAETTATFYSDGIIDHYENGVWDLLKI